MVQLNEIYEGEIISLKKGKSGIVTIKIQTNNKQGGQKNGFIRNLVRKLGGTDRRINNSLSGVLRNEKENDTRREASGRGSQASEEIASGHGQVNESGSRAEEGHGKSTDGSGEID